MNKTAKRSWQRVRQLSLALSLVTLVACSDSTDFVTDSGGAQQWDDLRGQYVVVNYFAEWCAPCLKELPELNEFHQLHQQEVTLLGVSFDPMNNDQLAELKTKHGIEFPLIQTTPTPNLPFPRPDMLPATYIVTPEGDVKGPLLGEQTLDSLRTAAGLG
ncbi:MAG: TlpA disulfide reductase family protein [Idiomarina sp.]